VQRREHDPEPDGEERQPARERGQQRVVGARVVRIAIVELEEQADLRIASNIVDCEPDSVRIGLPVEVRFERQDVVDESVYMPVFAPRTD
jgi:uncharacterized OB-fold protein